VLDILLSSNLTFGLSGFSSSSSLSAADLSLSSSASLSPPDSFVSLLSDFDFFALLFLALPLLSPPFLGLEEEPANYVNTVFIEKASPFTIQSKILY